jgi:restriction system protein
MLLEWIKSHAALEKENGPARAGSSSGSIPTGPLAQGLLWTSVAYQDEAPSIRSPAEMEGAIEHLGYAVFRRYQNQLTRAERARLDNTIKNALHKIDRYLERISPADSARFELEARTLRETIREHRERQENQELHARRAELKLAQLASLSPEGFEEFVGELFEALGYEVETVGGSGDEGVDLRLRRGDGMLAIVQCKYQKGVIGSPLLQKFLGTIHHTRSQKGFFVTTSTFTLAAEKFSSEQPIELVDGPRLVEMVAQALGPAARRDTRPALF